jgi:hypothetical protein
VTSANGTYEYIYLSAVIYNSNESFKLLFNESLTPKLEWRKEAVRKILQYGRNDMAAYVWKKDSQLFREIALTGPKEPRIFDLFKAPGCDAERADIFSLLVRDPQLAHVLNAAKSLVVRYTCWRDHEQLLCNLLEQLSETAKDINSGIGLYKISDCSIHAVT